VKALSWINFLLGLWLIIAGFALGGAGAVLAEEVVLGIIIALLAIGAARTESAALSWIVAAAGLWTLIAPAVINYAMHPSAKANDVVVGIIILVLGVANAVYRQSPVRTHTHA